MSWFTKTVTGKAPTIDESIRLAQSIINPHIAAARKLKTEEEMRDAITTLMMALAYSICLIASRFLGSSPKDFSSHMANFMEETMTTLKKKDNKNGPASTEAGDSGNTVN